MMRAAIVAILVVALVAVAAIAYIRPRGRSSRGTLPTLTGDEQGIAAELRRDIDALAGKIGERSVDIPAALHAAEEYIANELTATGLAVQRQTYDVAGVACSNVEVEIAGTSREEIVVVGAHYDTVPDSPGADDNASGVAATLALARRFAKEKPSRTVRFVFFVNEEPPHFLSADMGSYQYAKRSAERKEKIVAMLSIESIGFYDDRPGSQSYPPPLNFLYSNRGDFIGFVSNLGSRRLLGKVSSAFRKASFMPFEAAAAPASIPGIAWSDQWAFWEFGYPAVMITDTAIFRDPHYHTPLDRPRTLDFDRMTRVVSGLIGVVRDLSG